MRIYFLPLVGGKASCIVLKFGQPKLYKLFQKIASPGSGLIFKSKKALSTKSPHKFFLEDKVAKWWLPDDIVFVDELPHTATGKLLKTDLRDEYKEYLLNNK